MSPKVGIRISDSVGWLEVDHEAKLNAITFDMWAEIPVRCKELVAEAGSVKVVVIHGAGSRAFAVGADVSEFSTKRTGENLAKYELATTQALAAISSIPCPTIAMIRGYCMGGGLAVAMAADIRYCSSDAQFCLPPAKLGVGYPPLSTSHLVDLIGPAKAKELLYTADRIDADKAKHIGLVNKVTNPSALETFVKRRASLIASGAPLTHAASKVSVERYLRGANGVVDQVGRVDQIDAVDQEVEAALAKCGASKDYLEGIAAFSEGRPPLFKGE